MALVWNKQSASKSPTSTASELAQNSGRSLASSTPTQTGTAWSSNSTGTSTSGSSTGTSGSTGTKTTATSNATGTSTTGSTRTNTTNSSVVKALGDRVVGATKPSSTPKSESSASVPKTPEYTAKIASLASSLIPSKSATGTSSAALLSNILNKPSANTSNSNSSDTYKYTNSWDATKLTRDQQSQIRQLQEDWQKANAAGDQEAMNRAASAAATIRWQAGYRTDSSGQNPEATSAPNPPSGYVNDWDATKLSDEDKQKIAQAQADWREANAKKDIYRMQVAAKTAADIRAKYGYSTSADGTKVYEIDKTGMTLVDGSANGLLAAGQTFNGTEYSGHVLRANPNNTSNAKVGDIVITNGGAYFKSASGSVLLNKDVTTSNYTGEYSKVSSFEALKNLSYYTGLTAETGAVYQLNPNGTIPQGLEVGDLIVTDKGTQIIESIDSDGTPHMADYSAVTTNEGLTALYNIPNYKPEVSQEEFARMIADGKVDAIFEGNGKQFYEVRVDGVSYYVNSDGSYAVPGGISSKTMKVNGRDRVQQGVLLELDEGGQYWLPVDVSNLGVVWEYDATQNSYQPKDTDQRYVLYNGRTYNVNSGKSIGNYDDPDFDPTVDVMEYDGHFYDASGNLVDDKVNVKDKNMQTDNSAINQILDDLYRTNDQSPRLRDYDRLSWEQAQARAADQLNAAYNQRLKNNLDKLNRQALQTGFFGQLPAEQLRQQAVAENEVARQQAINELANTLYNNSYNEAQTEYNADTQRTQNQVSNLNTIFNAYQTYTKSMRDYETNMASLSQAEANSAYDRVLNAFTATMSDISNVVRSLDPELQGALIDVYNQLYQKIQSNFMNFTQIASQYSTEANRVFNQYNNSTYNYRDSQNNARTNYTRS